MITRLELDGFKTFQDFKLELAPFQVIVGPNGAGKSNLFDALRLLSHLADSDLRSAFLALRGEANELFMTLPDGQPTDRMHLAVEILVERQIQDSWGAQASLKYTRLRYELEIVRRIDERGLERLYVTYEALNPILRSVDTWSKRYIDEAQKDVWQPPLKAGRGTPFISTEMELDMATIHLHQDGHGGRKASVAEKVERTVLSGVTNTEFPHAFAAREEMRAWRFLHMNPEMLRQPSSMVAQPFVDPDGSNLPSALARMEAEDPLILNDVSRDLANLVPGILKIEVEKDQPRNRYLIWAKTQDGRSFSSQVLSDGTLRLLADPEALRIVIGTEMAAQELGLPGQAKQVESDPNPKQTLYQTAQKALANRLRRHRQISLGSLYEPLARQVSLERLSTVPAYRQFVTDLTETLITLRLAH